MDSIEMFCILSVTMHKSGQRYTWEGSVTKEYGMSEKDVYWKAVEELLKHHKASGPSWVHFYRAKPM